MFCQLFVGLLNELSFIVFKMNARFMSDFNQAKLCIRVELTQYNIQL